MAGRGGAAAIVDDKPGTFGVPLFVGLRSSDVIDDIRLGTFGAPLFVLLRSINGNQTYAPPLFFQGC